MFPKNFSYILNDQMKYFYSKSWVKWYKKNLKWFTFHLACVKLKQKLNNVYSIANIF